MKFTYIGNSQTHFRSNITRVTRGVWAREELVRFQHAVMPHQLNGKSGPLWMSVPNYMAQPPHTYFSVTGAIMEVWDGAKLVRFQHEMNSFTSSMGERPLRNINPILTQSPLIFPIKRFCNGNYVINIPLHIIPRITIPCSSVVELIGCYGYKDYPW